LTGLINNPTVLT